MYAITRWGLLAAILILAFPIHARAAEPCSDDSDSLGALLGQVPQTNPLTQGALPCDPSEITATVKALTADGDFSTADFKEVMGVARSTRADWRADTSGGTQDEFEQWRAEALGVGVTSLGEHAFHPCDLAEVRHALAGKVVGGPDFAMSVPESVWVDDVYKANLFDQAGAGWHGLHGEIEFSNSLGNLTDASGAVNKGFGSYTVPFEVRKAVAVAKLHGAALYDVSRYRFKSRGRLQAPTTAAGNTITLEPEEAQSLEAEDYIRIDNDDFDNLFEVKSVNAQTGVVTLGEPVGNVFDARTRVYKLALEYAGGGGAYPSLPESAAEENMAFDYTLITPETMKADFEDDSQILLMNGPRSTTYTRPDDGSTETDDIHFYTLGSNAGRGGLIVGAYAPGYHPTEGLPAEWLEAFGYPADQVAIAAADEEAFAKLAQEARTNSYGKWASNCGMLSDGTLHCLPANRWSNGAEVGVLTNPAIGRGQQMMWNGHVTGHFEMRNGQPVAVIDAIGTSTRIARRAAGGEENFINPVTVLKAYGFDTSRVGRAPRSEGERYLSNEFILYGEDN